MIETAIPLEGTLSDQDLLNLIEDFKEHVRKLPLVESGEGALITDPDDSRYYEESNQRWLKSASELNSMLGVTYKAATQQVRSEGIEIRASFEGTKENDDIPF